MRLRGFFIILTTFISLTASARAASLEPSWKRTVNRTATRAEFGQRLPVRIPFYLSYIIREASQKHGVDPNLIAAVTFKESAFNPNAVSRRGAQGLMQLMPKTAKSLGVTDAFDPRQNVLGGTKYLRMMLDMFDGDVALALAAYNAGPMRVKKHGVTATAEATEYVAKINTYL